MKQLLSFLLLLLVSSFSAMAQPQVKFLSDTYDFGAFDENDGIVKCRFTYVNTGNEPLAIVASRATCGCTSPSYTKAPVEPGDTGYVDVSYNPTGRPGRFGKKVYVDFNTEVPRTTLYIQGVVIGASNTLKSRYPIDAGALKLRQKTLLIGEVKNGRSKSVFFEVYNATTEPLSPTWVNLPRGVEVNTTTPTIPPGEQATYTVFFVPRDKDMYGIYTDTLTLQAAPDVDPIKVDMIAIVDEDFSKLTPGQRMNAPAIEVPVKTLDFDTINRTGGPVTGSFTIKNTGASTMEIRRVYTTDPGVTVTTDALKLKKGKSATVNVTIDPLAIPTEILNARISVIVNDPEHPTTIVRAVGQIN